jgi:O-antigen/teichoic acid export membrane protein
MARRGLVAQRPEPPRARNVARDRGGGCDLALTGKSDRPGRLAGRAFGNAVDQGISSLTNACVVILVAGALSVENFGWFSLALTVGLLALSAVRPLSGTLLLLAAEPAGEGAARAQHRAAVGAAVGLGVGFGVVFALAALVLPTTGRTLFLVLAVGFPFLAAQDCMRFVAFGGARPWVAAASDAGWLLCIALIVPLVRGHGVASPSAYLLIWEGGAVFGAVLAACVFRWLPDLRNGLAWAWRHGNTSRYLVGEIVASYGSVQLSILLVALVVGVGAAGEFRGAQTLLGPLTVIHMAVISFLLPELARRNDMTVESRVKIASLISVPLGIVNLAYGLIIVSLPSGVGEALLGLTWQGGREHILPLALWSAAAALCIGPLCSLQAMGRAQSAARISTALGTLILVFVSIGLYVDGSVAAAYGMALAQALVLFLWWPTMIRWARVKQVVAEGSGR